MQMPLGAAMKDRSHPGPCALLVAAMFLPAGQHALRAGDLRYPICDVALNEERSDRKDAELELDVSRSTVAAYRQIYELLEGLWAADAIDRMSYLHGKYDYESAKLTLERAELIVAREKAEEQQYRLICGEPAAGESAADRARALERASKEYYKADCDQWAKAIEVARVNLGFNRQFLASVLDLREGQVATRQDVILAELDVEREQKRLADAERRTEACRRELGQPVTADSPQGD